MATFSPVNAGLSTPEDSEVAGAPVPTTPTPGSSAAERLPRDINVDESSPNTPTGHSFGGISGQRPLPNALPSLPDPHHGSSDGIGEAKGDGSHRSAKLPSESQDVEMGGADDDDRPAEDDASDDESADGTQRTSSKKKKGQRFFCTEFPPCQLSFTRSEHLARHIRCDQGGAICS